MRRKDLCKRGLAALLMAALTVSSVPVNMTALAKPVNAVIDVEKEANVGTAPALKDIGVFTVSEVTLEDAYMANATQKEIKYLTSFDTDRLLAGFRETVGLDMKGKTRYGGWENMLIGGHCVGHYMTAIAQAYCSVNVSAEDKEKLLKIMEDLINGLDECQQKSGSYGGSKAGYLFGATLKNKSNVELQFDNVEAGKTDIFNQAWVPWYTMHKLVAGLLEIAKIESTNTDMQAISEKALTVVEKLGEWCYNREKTWSTSKRNTVLSIEYGGMNDVLYQLYEFADAKNYATADHFREAAHLFDEDTLFEDVYNAAEDSNILNGKHANTTIPKFLGALQGYVTTKGGNGTENYLKYAEKFWKMVVEHNTYITGDNSEWEHFRTVDKLDANRTACNCETCNAYNMLKMSRLLYQITGEKKYIDFYENTFINTILSSQNPETGMTTYFQPMASGYFKVYSTDFTKFWCCTGSGMESFTKLNDSIFYKKDNKLIVNQFFSSTVNWKEKNLTIQQVSDIPNSTKTTFKITKTDEAGSDATIDLYLRIPDWACGAVTVKVGDEAYELSADKITTNGYAIVSGLSAGSTVTYNIPMQVVPYTVQDAAGELFAFKYGPVVLSAELDEVDWEANTDKTGVEVTIPKNKVIDSETIAITTDDAESVEQFMEKIDQFMVRDESKDALTFKLEGTNSDIQFTEHFRQYTHRYGIYWYFLKDESKMSEAVIAGKANNRLTTNQIGEGVRPGYSQDEAAHLTDNGSTSSSSPAYRLADANGSFTYKFEIRKGEDNYLVCDFNKDDYDSDKTIRIMLGSGAEKTTVFEGTVKQLAAAYKADTSPLNEEADGDKFFTAEIRLEAESLTANSYTDADKNWVDLTFSSKTGTDASAKICNKAFVRGSYKNTNSITEAKAYGPDNKELPVQVSKEAGRITVDLGDTISAGKYGVKITLEDTNGYFTINTFDMKYAIDDSKIRYFNLADTAEQCYRFDATLFAEDHESAVDYKIVFVKTQKCDPAIEYFVDCGDYLPETVSDGDALGARNSLTEQIYGVDPKTGYKWGVADSISDPLENDVPAGAAAGGVVTDWSWPFENNPGDGLDKTDSNRYTKNQYEKNISVRHLDYAFELDNGQYEVEVGFSNPWGCSDKPRLYADYGTDNKQVISESIVVPDQGKTTVKGVVTVKNNKLTLNARSKSNDGDTLAINITYIKIYKRDMSKAEVSLAEKASVYTGKATTPAVTVKYDGKSLNSGTDYSVTYKNNVNAGTATLTVVGEGLYKGTKELTYTITKAPNPLSVAKNTLNVKQSTKSQSITFDKFGITGAKGTVRYQSNNKSVTINNNKIVIAKNFKGTADITITAGGDANYESKTATVRIIVDPANPAATKISKKKALKKGFRITLKKVAKASGYEIIFATDKKFKKNKVTKTVKKTAFTAKKLKAKKTYYVKARVFIKNGKAKTYSKWSKVVKIKTKA